MIRPTCWSPAHTLRGLPTTCSPKSHPALCRPSSHSLYPAASCPGPYAPKVSKNLRPASRHPTLAPGPPRDTCAAVISRKGTAPSSAHSCCHLLCYPGSQPGWLTGCFSGFPWQLADASTTAHSPVKCSALGSLPHLGSKLLGHRSYLFSSVSPIHSSLDRYLLNSNDVPDAVLV